MNIHWLVHNPLHGDAAEIYFAGESSLLSEPDSVDEH